MSFLILDGVSKYYGAFGALIDMNLSVKRGEFISLLGPSGCGKTTTLQTLAGFVAVTRGTIWLNRQDVPQTPGHQPHDSRRNEIIRDKNHRRIIQMMFIDLLTDALLRFAREFLPCLVQFLQFLGQL